MAQRRSQKIEITTFPFLSVLCCIIGVMLLFMVLVMTSRAFEKATTSPSGEIPVTPSEPEAGIPQNQFDELKQQINELSAELVDRQSELASWINAISELRDVLAMKEAELNDPDDMQLVKGFDLEKPQDVEFLPVSSSPTGKTARFLEVKFDSFIIQPQNIEFPKSDLQKSSSELMSFFQSIHANNENESLVVLIHPNGFASFTELRNTLKQAYSSSNPGEIDFGFGFEPFDKNWGMFFTTMAAAPVNESSDEPTTK